jgi:FkbM family methyltransferase
MIDWLRSFSGSDIFLDVGANVGLYTVPAALQGCKTYAVELDLLNCSILQENLVINQVTDLVTIFPVALGNAEELTRVFYRDFSPGGGDALQSLAQPSKLDTRKLPRAYSLIQPMLPFEALVGRYGLEQPTKVKIDVDGNERYVWPGIRSVVARASEVYLELGNDDFSHQILLDLKAAGFYEVRRQEINRPGNPANILFRRQSNDK